jgi:acetyltransferase
MTDETKTTARRPDIDTLRRIFSPHSVAVIGASRGVGTLGRIILRSLLDAEFTGVIYPVNPNADSILSIKAYPSVNDVPGHVDLAIIVVPAKIVLKVAEECGRKGVGAMVVISDGFRERGPIGGKNEKLLREIARKHGMRLVGPNCMGVINTDPGISLNGTFSRVFPPRGNVSFLSQSGAMGLVTLRHASDLNIGISTFISVGNRADVSANDMLMYWEHDEATKVILLYLESFGNPRRFARTAKRISYIKPIVAVKSGNTPAGSRAALSHTGALATSAIISDALFHQAGIIRVDSVEELFDLAALMSNQPIPKGNRIAIVTNGGGPGTMAADFAERNGLRLPQFKKATAEKISDIIMRDIRINNPLDLTAGATPEVFEHVLRLLAADRNYDSVLTIFIPPTTMDTSKWESAIGNVAASFAENDKPIVACFIGQHGITEKLGSQRHYVPTYLFPEDAMRAIARATLHGELIRKPQGKIPALEDIDRDCARAQIDSLLKNSKQNTFWLSNTDIAALLQCYGIHFIETQIAKTPEEAEDIAVKLGLPVAVKLNSSTIIHKTDVGGVVVDVRTKSRVGQAFNDIKEQLTQLGRQGEMDGVMIQPMVKGSFETIVGVTQDKLFGPLIMFGTGGIYSELLDDVAVRLHPLTDSDAEELIGSIKMAKLFDGFRGAPPSDKKSLVDLLLRLSALIEDVPEIAELDLNPVKVMPAGQGYVVVDARILVAETD